MIKTKLKYCSKICCEIGFIFTSCKLNLTKLLNILMNVTCFNRNRMMKLYLLNSSCTCGFMIATHVIIGLKLSEHCCAAEKHTSNILLVGPQKLLFKGLYPIIAIITVIYQELLPAIVRQSMYT